MQADTLLADKAFDADQRVIQPLLAAGKTAVIPPKRNRRPRVLSTRTSTRPVISSKTSTAGSSNSAPSPLATTRQPEISSPQSTSPLQWFGSIEDRP
jgi:hypothetical protein